MASVSFDAAAAKAGPREPWTRKDSLRALQPVLSKVVTGPITPFRSCCSYLKESCAPASLIIILVTLAGTGVLAFLAQDKESVVHDMFEVCMASDFTLCTKGSDGCNCRCEPWKGLLVGNVLVIAILAMVQGFRSEFVLVPASVLLGSCGVISEADVLSGFAFSGNIVIQALLVLVHGIQDSGVLDVVFLTLLGSPTSVRAALLRSQLLSATLSAILQQQTVAMAAAPTLQIWGPQVGLNAHQLLLPFTCAGGVGGNLLLISSAVSLAAAELMPKAKLQQLDTVPVTIIATAISCIYGALMSRRLLHAGPLPDEERVTSTDYDYQLQQSLGERFIIDFQVGETSLLLGRTPAQAGLLGVPEATPLFEEEIQHKRLAVGDVLSFKASAASIPNLRRRGPGLWVKDPKDRSSVDKLGAKRHLRRLYEAGVSMGSRLVGSALPPTVQHAHCLAVRRPGIAAATGSIQVGDVLLLEAFDNFADLQDVRRDFAFTAIVPASIPPRHGRARDTCRGVVAMVLLVGMFILSVFHIAPMTFLALFAVFFAVMMNAVHRDMLLQYLNLPIFLVLAGGLGLSKCLIASGVANAMAKGVVLVGNFVTRGSSFGSLIALSLITSALSSLMSNTASVAIMAPISNEVCHTQGMSYKTTALVLIYAANCVFATPFCVSANMIIKEQGGYAFTDYVRFGLPLQLMFVVAIPFICVLIFGA